RLLPARQTGDSVHFRCPTGIGPKQRSVRGRLPPARRMITPRQKRALNRALHELRRPLQALVLLEDGSGHPAAAPRRATRRGLLELATTALHDLDGALNGGCPARTPRRFSCRESVMACLERWRPQAGRAGGVRVYWDAGPAMVDGDAARLAQALDNLLSNAL